LVPAHADDAARNRRTLAWHLSTSGVMPSIR
jgi:hypothetical protein